MPFDGVSRLAVVLAAIATLLLAMKYDHRRIPMPRIASRWRSDVSG
jgi:hypothetical protein